MDFAAFAAADSSEPATAFATSSITHTSATFQGIGDYIAQDFGLDGSSMSSISSSDRSPSLQSRTNLNSGSSPFPRTSKDPYLVPSTTYFPEDPGFSPKVKLLTSAGSASAASATTLHLSPPLDARNISALLSLSSSLTANEQASSTFQNSSDPDRFCMTAAARYPDHRHAVGCYCSLSSWYSSYRPYSSRYLTQTWNGTSGLTLTTSTSIYTSTLKLTITPTDVTPYTLCDGWARVNASRVTETTVSIITSTYTYYQPSEANASIPTFAPRPACDMTPAECVWLYYNASLPGDAVARSYDNAVLGLCADPAHLGDPCLVTGGPIKLLYFPEPSNPDHICKARNSTNLPRDSNNIELLNKESLPLVTAQTLGTTFTSGTAYLSISTLYAYHDGFGDRIGPTFSDYILPLASTQVHTICYNWDGPEPASVQELGSPLDFRNLNYPVPGTAYSCASGCGVPAFTTNTTQCTVYDDFKPILALPPTLTQLAPEWAPCSLWDKAINNFWYDPPTALVPQSAAATPTDTFDPVVTKPAPSPIISPATLAQVTQPMQPQPQPSPLDSLPGSTAVSPHPGKPAHTFAPSQPINPAPPIISIIGSSHPASVDPGSGDSIPASKPSDGASSTSVDPGSGDSAPVAQPSNPGGIIPSTIVGSSAVGNLPATFPNANAASDPIIPIISASENSGGGNSAHNSAETWPIAGSSGGSSDPNAPVTDPAPNPLPIGTVGGQPISTDPFNPSGVIIGGRPLTPGQATIINGHTASVASSGVIVIDGYSTIPIHASVTALGAANPDAQLPSSSSSISSQPYAILTLDSSAITVAPMSGSSSVFIIDGSSLTVGGAPAVIDGRTLSAASSGIVVQGSNGASTVQFSSAAGSGLDAGAAESGAVLTLGPQGSLVTATPVAGPSGVYRVGGTEITVGGTAAIYDGQTVSAAPGGVVVEGSNEDAYMAAFSSMGSRSGNQGEVIFTANGHTYNAQEININGKEVAIMSGAGLSQPVTMTIGGAAVTTDRMTLSAASSAIMIDGSMAAFSSVVAAQVEATLTLGGDKVTVLDVPRHTNEVVIDGITLTEGGSAVMTNGETVSFGASGIVIGGKTPSETVALSTGGGGVGLDTGDGPSDGNGSVATTMKANADRMRGENCIVWAMMLASLVVCWMVTL